MFSHFKEYIKKAICKKHKSPCSSYSKIVSRINIGNLLVAVSTTGMMTLGVLPMSITTIVVFAGLFLVLGVIGRYVDSVEDDMERLMKYEEYLGTTPSCSLPSVAGIDSMEQQDNISKE